MRKIILILVVLLFAGTVFAGISKNDLKAKKYSDDPNNTRNTKMLIFGENQNASCNFSGKCSYDFYLYNDNNSDKFLNLNSLYNLAGISVTSVKQETSIQVTKTKTKQYPCISILTSWALDGNGIKQFTYTCSNDNSKVDNNVSAKYTTIENVTEYENQFQSISLNNTDFTTYQDTKGWYNKGQIKQFAKIYNAFVPSNDSIKLRMEFDVPKKSSGQFFIETSEENSLLDPWFNSSWSYDRPILMSNPNVYMDINSMMTLVFDSSTLISAGKAQSDCDDIIPVYSDGAGNFTQIKRGIAYGTCNTSTTIMKFQLPIAIRNIDFNGSGQDSNAIYLYYGNSGTSITADNNYASSNLALWLEMDNNSGLTYYDSSKNYKHATALAGTLSVTGKYGNAFRITGNNQYLSINMNTADMNWGVGNFSWNNFASSQNIAGSTGVFMTRYKQTGNDFLSFSRLNSTFNRLKSNQTGALIQGCDYTSSAMSDNIFYNHGYNRGGNGYDGNQFWNGTKVCGGTSDVQHNLDTFNVMDIGTENSAGSGASGAFTIDSVMVFKNYLPNDYNGSQVWLDIGGEQVNNTDVDFNFSIPKGIYTKSNRDINFRVVDPDNNSWLVDFNWSWSATKGTGTPVYKDINTASSLWYCSALAFGFMNGLNCGLLDYNFSGVPDGNIYLLASFKTSTGASIYKDSNTLVWDTNKPKTFWNGTNNSWSSSDQNIRFTYSDKNAHSPINSIGIRYRVDNGTWRDVNADLNASGLIINWDGNHILDFNSTDVVGNVGDMNEQYILRDTASPTNSAKSPSVAASVGNTTPTFSSTWSDTNSGLNLCTYKLYKNNISVKTGLSTIIGGVCTYTVLVADGFGDTDTGFVNFDVNDAVGNKFDVNTAVYTIALGTPPPTPSPSGGGGGSSFIVAQEETGLGVNFSLISQEIISESIRQGSSKSIKLILQNIGTTDLKGIKIEITGDIAKFIEIPDLSNFVIKANSKGEIPLKIIAKDDAILNTYNGTITIKASDKIKVIQTKITILEKTQLSAFLNEFDKQQIAGFGGRIIVSSISLLVGLWLLNIGSSLGGIGGILISIIFLLG